MDLRKRISILLSLSAGILLLGSCNKLKLYNHQRGEVLAVVGEKVLYSGDVAGMIEPGLPEADSLSMLESIVENWVRKQVRIEAAENALSGDRQDIEEMVSEYRSTLMSHRYEQEWLASRLDTTVTPAQITEYYNANRDELRLAGPVVKARVARIPAGLRQSSRLEQLFRSANDSDWEEFQSMAQKNQYRVEDFTSGWSDFSAVIQYLPFPQTNFDEFLSTRRYYEVEDDQYKYMMYIDSFRHTGDYSPQDRETDNIRRIILNKRRQSLLTVLEDSLYNTAAGDRRIDIRIK